MSQFNPVPPVSYPPVDPGQVPEARSGWPVIIGVIAIVFGVIGSGWFCLQTAGTFFMSAAGQMMEQAAAQSNDPNAAEQAKAMKAVFDASTKYQIPTAVVNGGLMVAGVLLLVGGIGCCMRAAWSRPLILFWALLKIGLVIASSAIGYLTFEAQQQAIRQLPPGTAMPGMMGMGSGVGLVMVVLVGIWLIALPVFMLIFFNMNRIKSEVESWRAVRAAIV